MYINNKYQWVKGQGYDSWSKVKNARQSCLLQYRLYITSSTFLYSKMLCAGKLFAGQPWPVAVKCHTLDDAITWLPSGGWVYVCTGYPPLASSNVEEWKYMKDLGVEGFT